MIGEVSSAPQKWGLNASRTHHGGGGGLLVCTALLLHVGGQQVLLQLQHRAADQGAEWAAERIAALAHVLLAHVLLQLLVQNLLTEETAHDRRLGVCRRQVRTVRHLCIYTHMQIYAFSSFCDELRYSWQEEQQPDPHLGGQQSGVWTSWLHWGRT